jgi:hypothetical protein
MTIKIKKDSIEVELLNRYVDETIILFKKSKKDRGILQKNGYFSKSEPSILDEIELLSDTVAGLISSMQHFQKWTDQNAELLKKARDDSRDFIANWLTKNRKKYPKFSKYVEMVDYLVLLVLQQKSATLL